MPCSYRHDTVCLGRQRSVGRTQPLPRPLPGQQIPSSARARPRQACERLGCDGRIHATVCVTSTELAGTLPSRRALATADPPGHTARIPYRPPASATVAQVAHCCLMRSPFSLRRGGAADSAVAGGSSVELAATELPDRVACFAIFEDTFFTSDTVTSCHAGCLQSSACTCFTDRSGRSSRTAAIADASASMLSIARRG